MKFCTMCGQQIDDNMPFCPYCGAPQQTAQQPQQAAPQPQQAAPQPQQAAPQPQQAVSQPQQAAPQPQQAAPQPQQAAPQPQQAAPQPQQAAPQFGQYQTPPPMQAGPGGPGPQAPKKPLDKKLLFIIIGAAAFVLIVIGIICGLSGRRGAGSYKGAVEKLFNALADGSAKKTVHIMMPAELEKAADKELQGGELEYLGYDSMQDFIDDMYSTELDKDMQFQNVEITDKDKLSKDELEEIEEQCSDEMGCDIKVKEAYKLEIEYEYREKGDKKWHDDYMEMTAYKVGGRWYIFPW
ncbi:MAG: zinc ribbon domain-containing protein [Eubacterium sp.]|nr:zinc ribbon domain-containing protein [Eubacterium sp.]